MRGHLSLTLLLLGSSIAIVMYSKECNDSTLDRARQCQGNWITRTTSCDAFASCADILWANQTSVTLDCLGAASCINSRQLGQDSYISTSYNLHGFISAANIEARFDTNAHMWSTGSMAWVNMVADQSLYIDSTNDGLSLYGFAYAGFGNLIATQIHLIEGNAYYAHYNNTGYISSNGEIELRSRLAAYNSTFICLAGYTCEIDCNDHPTACYGVRFICGKNETNTSVCMVNNCNQTLGIWCPIGWWEILSNYSDNPGNNLTWQYLEVDDKFLPKNYGPMNYDNFINVWEEYYTDLCIDLDEILTFNYSNSVNFVDCDDDLGCQGVTKEFYFSLNETSWRMTVSYPLNKSGICLRGNDAGFSTQLWDLWLYQPNQDNQDVETLEPCGLDIYCDGDTSCNSVGVFYARDVYVRASFSLTFVDEIHSCGGDLVCQSDHSCDNIGIISGFNNIYCFGYNSCAGIGDIYNVTNIYLFGSPYVSGKIWTDGNNGVNLYIDTYPTLSSFIYVDIICRGFDVCTVYCFEARIQCASQTRFFGCGNGNWQQYSHNVSQQTLITINDSRIARIGGNGTCNVVQYKYTHNEDEISTTKSAVKSTIQTIDTTAKTTRNETT